MLVRSGLLLVCIAGSVYAAEEQTTLPSAAAAEKGLSLTVGASSDYAVHGLTRSQGRPVVNAQVGYGLGAGWQLAARGSTMNLNRGPGPSKELALYLGHHRALSDDWNFGANLAYYAYRKNSAFLPYNYSEATIEATWRAMWKLRLQYSPDYSIVARGRPAREFSTWTGELQGNYALYPGLQATAALGYYDLSRGVGEGYFFWTLGAVASRRQFSVALSYVAVDARAKAMFNPYFTHDKLIATVAWRIR
jgi:uncharacterized protein (TIGR02001 family)